MNLDTGIGLLIPFIGTSAGAACVFFMKKSLSRGVQRALTGFASGVMVAASIWSLLIPAMQQAEPMGKLSFLPAVIGFWCGILFLLLLDSIIPHLHMNANQAEGPKSRLARTTMMVLAVTLHNIPEGMAVGVVYAGFLSGSAEITAGGRWPFPWASPFKTSRKGPSFPCRCMRRERIRAGRSGTGCCPAR